MSINFVVRYDGSKASKDAARFVLQRSKTCDATLVISHVLEEPPNSCSTPTETEERHACRNKKPKRVREALIDPLLEKIKGEAGSAESVIRYGSIVDTIMAIAKGSDATQI